MSVEFTVLRCLIEGPSHGYRLQKILAGFRHTYPMGNVNVYPLLKDLERGGLVSSRVELHTARSRKVYSITDAGIQAFEAWVASPPELHIPEIRDPVYLRLLLSTIDGVPRAWLGDCIASIAEERERAQRLYDAGRASRTAVGELAAQEILDCLDRRRDFLERVRQLLDGEAASQD